MTLDRERNLSKYAALLTAAKAEQDRGDLKAAYVTYLEAHRIIIHILSSQVVFKDKESLESAPGNYTQLFAHAQEILRRLKDIVDLSKSHESLSSSPALPASTSSTKSSKPSSISPPIRPGLGPSRPSQRSVATTATTTTQNYKRARKNIPMIPISPLTKQSLLHSYALSQVTQKLEQAKQGSSSQQQPHQQSEPGSPSLSASRDLAHLRRLIEDVRIQRAKLDTVSIQIQSVASSTITSWNPDTIAKQLTIIDAQLFKDVAIPRDLVRADRHRNSRAQNCIDFENYITHSFTHLLLLEWIAVRQPSPAASPAASKNHSHTPVNAVAHTIRIAHILLHVYRNFNCFRALMRALTSPEIKRMHKLWSGIPSKTKDTYRRLVTIYQDQAEKGGYKGALIQKLDAFQDVGRDAMVAIPWMRYHQDEVKSIIQSYLTGQESSGGSTDIVLSAPGARKLSAVTALLLQCRSNDPGNFDRQETDSRSGSVSHTKHRESVQVDGLKTPLSPVWDLISLGAGDATLHHWLLSRPFLNKQQLIDESLEIEPLFNGEELPVHETPMDLDESDDSASLAGDVDQNESFEQVMQPEQALEPSSAPLTLTQRSTRPAWTRTPVSESEVNDIMNELLNDDASDSRGLFGDSDDDNDNNDSTSPSGSSRPRLTRGVSGSSVTKSPLRTRDVFEFLGIQSEDASNPDDETSEDLDARTSSSPKNKGKALWDGDDDEDLNSLMAKVKGLVHESKAFTQEVESRPESVKSPQDDFENDPWGKDDDDESYSRKKFEPFQQGNEEEEWGVDSSVAPVTTSTSDETAPSALSSLDALRKQFASLGPVPVSDDIADDFISPKSEPSGESSKNDLDATKAIPIPTVEEPVNTESVMFPPSSTSGAGPAATSLSTTSSLPNPFAPFMITKPTGSADLHSPPNVIGKARKRKILVDRSGNVNDPAAAAATAAGVEDSNFPGDKTPTALSPPRHIVGLLSPLEASDETMAAIAVKAKMSLAGVLSGTSSSGSHDGSSGNKENFQDDDAEVVSPVSKTTGNGGSGAASSDEVASVSIQELDKLAALFRSIDVKFTLTVDDSSDDDDNANKHTVADSEPKVLFQLGANLFEGSHDEAASLISSTTTTSSAKDATSSTVPANEDNEHSTQHQQQRQEETGEPSSSGNINSNNTEEEKSKSPRSDHEGTGGLGGESGSLDSRTRANRQRRRIAGGVISLPTPSKTLVAIKSTSSLSNAFKESSTATAAAAGASASDRSEDDKYHTAELEHEHEHGQEQDEMLVTTAMAKKEAEGGDDHGDDVETTRNGDSVLETMMADVEVNVTIDEANSLLKTPSVASSAVQKDEDDNTEEAK
ncbi:hypothetical protein BG015_002651 [Linnemannia schmuckeri]|uniref:Ras-GEF domain-containing protein n=1 Tax=Linnemannia schmuckeri TaxID=64567 RepID=A0A9P5S5J7_9FUNG|nr:hypothetical protein BG015_002651 [Linnemannia schmuckeri]